MEWNILQNVFPMSCIEKCQNESKFREYLTIGCKIFTAFYKPVFFLRQASWTRRVFEKKEAYYYKNLWPAEIFDFKLSAMKEN